jgi:chromosome segregation ATPase
MNRAERHDYIVSILRNPEYAGWSNRRIAALAGVSHVAILKIRRSLPGNRHEVTSPQKVTRREVTSPQKVTGQEVTALQGRISLARKAIRHGVLKRNARLEKACQDHQVRVAALQAQIEDACRGLKTAKDILAEELRWSRQQRRRAIERCLRMRANLTDIKAENAALQSRFDEAQDRMSRMAQDIEKSNKSNPELAFLREQVRELERANEDLVEERDQAIEARQTAAREFEAYNGRDLADAVDDLVEAIIGLNARDREMADLRWRYRDLMMKLATMPPMPSNAPCRPSC